jgi:hypothetical protein
MVESLLCQAHISGKVLNQKYVNRTIAVSHRTPSFGTTNTPDTVNKVSNVARAGHIYDATDVLQLWNILTIVSV